MARPDHEILRELVQICADFVPGSSLEAREALEARKRELHAELGRPTSWKELRELFNKPPPRRPEREILIDFLRLYKTFAPTTIPGEGLDAMAVRIADLAAKLREGRAVLIQELGREPLLEELRALFE